MARESETDRLRDEEREVETEAAYAGGGEEEEGGFEQFKFPECEKVDDMKVADRVVREAHDEGGASGPGIEGGSSESTY